jgi:aspartate aminotransferase
LKILDRGVICAPGSAFGSHGEGHMRISYANSRDNIAKGLDVVKDVAAQL